MRRAIVERSKGSPRCQMNSAAVKPFPLLYTGWLSQIGHVRTRSATQEAVGIPSHRTLCGCTVPDGSSVASHPPRRAQLRRASAGGMPPAVARVRPIARTTRRRPALLCARKRIDPPAIVSAASNEPPFVIVIIASMGAVCS